MNKNKKVLKLGVRKDGGDVYYRRVSFNDHEVELSKLRTYAIQSATDDYWDYSGASSDNNCSADDNTASGSDRSIISNMKAVNNNNKHNETVLQKLHKVMLYYVDEDGDKIQICTQRELDEVLMMSQEDNNTKLKIMAKVKPVKKKVTFNTTEPAEYFTYENPLPLPPAPPPPPPPPRVYNSSYNNNNNHDHHHYISDSSSHRRHRRTNAFSVVDEDDYLDDRYDNDNKNNNGITATTADQEVQLFSKATAAAVAFPSFNPGDERDDIDSSYDDEDEGEEEREDQDLIDEWDEIRSQFPVEACRRGESELRSHATNQLLALEGLRHVKEEVIRLWRSVLEVKLLSLTSDEGDDDEKKKKLSMIPTNYCFLFGNDDSGDSNNEANTSKNVCSREMMVVARFFATVLYEAGVNDSPTLATTTGLKAKNADDGSSDSLKKLLMMPSSSSSPPASGDGTGSASGSSSTNSSDSGLVLFIDNAHELDPVNDDKGKEIVNELSDVVGSNHHNHRRVSVIMTGNKDALERKLFAYNNNNDDFKSKFRMVPFQNYNSEELVSIWMHCFYIIPRYLSQMATLKQQQQQQDREELNHSPSNNLQPQHMAQYMMI